MNIVQCSFDRHASAILDVHVMVGFKFGRWLDLAFYQLVLDTPSHPIDG
jgi:L-amino acid N-acyltransferase YncA